MRLWSVKLAEKGLKPQPEASPLDTDPPPCTGLDRLTRYPKRNGCHAQG